MSKVKFLALVLAGACIVPTIARAQYADEVISYSSGTGFASGFTTASAALGAPALGSGVTPFAPPSSKSQIVSIGAGGEITLQFNTPIENNAANPFGIDFSVFANPFFISSGGNVNGLFSHAISATIQVSRDDATWYTLNSALAPQPGQLFPTDGAGNPLIPVNPALTQGNFNGKNLAGIESLYAGSAGGAGYDLAWAEDASGNSVDLPDADFVRIEVQMGVLDLDAISEIAPAPEVFPTFWCLVLACAGLFGFSRRTKCVGQVWTACLKRAAVLPLTIALMSRLAVVNAGADTLIENFTNNPATDGWQIFGDATRFQWDSTNHDMIVHWDSAQPNSYFYHGLPSTLTKENDFSVAFDLNLSDVASGTTPGKPSIFELAIGFINLADASGTNFFRGAGTEAGGPVNLLEFDYFPDFISDGTNYGATVGPTIVASDNTFNYDGETFPLDLTLGASYHIVMTYTASNQTLVTLMTSNGAPFGPVNSVYLPDAFTPDEDFQLNQIAICNFNDGDQDPMYPEGSIQADGTVGNFVVITPPPVANLTGSFIGATWQTQFSSRIDWLYTLERTGDLQSWTAISDATPGNGFILTLQDTNAPSDKAFYRVLATQPPPLRANPTGS